LCDVLCIHLSVCTVVPSLEVRPLWAELPLRSDVTSLPYDPRSVLTVRCDLWCTPRNLSPGSYWPASRSGTGHRIGVRSSLYRATGIDITDPRSPRQVGSGAPAAPPETSGSYALTCEYAADPGSRATVSQASADPDVCGVTEGRSCRGPPSRYRRRAGHRSGAGVRPALGHGCAGDYAVCTAARDLRPRRTSATPPASR